LKKFDGDNCIGDAEPGSPAIEIFATPLKNVVDDRESGVNFFEISAGFKFRRGYVPINREKLTIAYNYSFC
jgi:hypothetical protein